MAPKGSRGTPVGVIGIGTFAMAHCLDSIGSSGVVDTAWICRVVIRRVTMWRIPGIPEWAYKGLNDCSLSFSRDHKIGLLDTGQKHARTTARTHS